MASCATVFGMNRTSLPFLGPNIQSQISVIERLGTPSCRRTPAPSSPPGASRLLGIVSPLCRAVARVTLHGRGREQSRLACANPQNSTNPLPWSAKVRRVEFSRGRLSRSSLSAVRRTCRLPDPVFTTRHGPAASRKRMKLNGIPSRLRVPRDIDRWPCGVLRAPLFLRA